MTLTAERLREVLSYDLETGVFTRLISSGPSRVGDVAGGVHHSGYIFIRVDGHKYAAHRLAWLYITGEWPKTNLDHKDLNKRGNNFGNIRMATRSQNGANRRAFSNNKSGLKGVRWHKHVGKWQADIRINGKKKHLLYSDCPAAAHFAYIIAADKAFGEFARAN